MVHVEQQILTMHSTRGPDSHLCPQSGTKYTNFFTIIAAIAELVSCNRARIRMGGKCIEKIRELEQEFGTKEGARVHF